MPAQPHFTPPNKNKVIVASTRMYDRVPEWKTYTNMGHARSGFSQGPYVRQPDGNWLEYARKGELWVLNNGEWELEFYSDGTILKDELPWKK